MCQCIGPLEGLCELCADVLRLQPTLNEYLRVHQSIFEVWAALWASSGLSSTADAAPRPPRKADNVRNVFAADYGC